MRLEHEAGTVLASAQGGRLVWQYHHTPVAAGQPCFHPVNTLAGYTLSLLSPWDHIHHTGLWFSWKFIDGVNVWEGPARPPVESQIIPLALEVQDSGFLANYRWERADGVALLNGTLLCQSRVRGENAYTIDLLYRFLTPGAQPVLLDRNPPPQAGYAGMSMRYIREFRHASYLDADGRSSLPERGTPTRWHTYSGPIDGGPQRYGGAALMDHPANPRFPAPTYSIHEREEFSFLQYAILYNAPMLLQPTESLDLRYRIVVYDGLADADMLNAAFDEFAAHYSS